jgi:hypothetical protein
VRGLVAAGTEGAEGVAGVAGVAGVEAGRGAGMIRILIGLLAVNITYMDRCRKEFSFELGCNRG